jgi:phage gp46-like protein
MIDFNIVTNPDGLMDIGLVNGAFQECDDILPTFMTAVFTDSPADPSAIVNPLDRGGYAGDFIDSFRDARGTFTGTQIWLLENKQLTKRTGLAIVAEVESKLRLMVEDNHLWSFDVKHSIDMQMGSLQILLNLQLPGGSDIQRALSFFNREGKVF